MTELVLRQAGAAWRVMRRLDRVWLLVLAIPLLLVLVDPAGAQPVLETALGAFAGTLPYMALAIALMGALKASSADGVVAEAFRGREVRMIVLAALVGGLAPFCSCEVIPFIAALLAAGTPLPAVMAFWLASPLMDPPTFAITAGALGPEFAIGKTVAAVGLGLTGGFGLWMIQRTGALAAPLKAARQAGGCGCGGSKAPERPVWRFWRETRRRQVFAQAALEQALFLGKWLGFAYLLEGLMIRYVPAEAIGAVVGGPGVGPVVLGALVGLPAYLNGYAAPALVSGLMEQGMSAGAAMAFMVAGAVSCIPAMAAVWALVRVRVFALYIGFGIGGAILSGLVFGAAMAL